MNQGNSVIQRLTDRSKVDRCSVENDVAGIRCLNTGEDLHECTFAGSVFTDNRQNFAFTDMQVHMMQSTNARKALADAPDLESTE